MSTLVNIESTDSKSNALEKSLMMNSAFIAMGKLAVSFALLGVVGALYIDNHNAKEAVLQKKISNYASTELPIIEIYMKAAETKINQQYMGNYELMKDYLYMGAGTNKSVYKEKYFQSHLKNENIYKETMELLKNDKHTIVELSGLSIEERKEKLNNKNTFDAYQRGLGYTAKKDSYQYKLQDFNEVTSKELLKLSELKEQNQTKNNF